jgi:hypothetical protein
MMHCILHLRVWRTHSEVKKKVSWGAVPLAWTMIAIEI